jgi:hypothetical protein
MHLVFECDCITFDFPTTLHAATEQTMSMNILFCDETLCTLVDHYTSLLGGNCCDFSTLKIMVANFSIMILHIMEVRHVSIHLSY